MSNFDDSLLAATRQALHEVDPVPPDAVAAAKAVFLTRHLDAELAALVSDSARDGAVLAMRGSAPRALSFQADQRSIELEIHPDRGRIRGQIAPPAAASLTLELDGVAVETTTADELGRFVFSRIDDATTVAVRVSGDDHDLLCTFDL